MKGSFPFMERRFYQFLEHALVSHNSTDTKLYCKNHIRYYVTIMILHFLNISDFNIKDNIKY